MPRGGMPVAAPLLPVGTHPKRGSEERPSTLLLNLGIRFPISRNALKSSSNCYAITPVEQTPARATVCPPKETVSRIHDASVFLTIVFTSHGLLIKTVISLG